MKRRSSSRVPACVAELHRRMDAKTRRYDRIMKHLIPTPSAIWTLIGYFKERVRIEGDFHRSTRLRRMEPDWHVRHSPCHHFHELRFEHRQRMYAYVLKVLRTHAPALTRRRDPRAWRDRFGRHAMRNRLHHGVDALATVGAWWIAVNREGVSPRVTLKERKAFRLCARIERLRTKDSEKLDAGRFAKALEWENRRLKAMGPPSEEFRAAYEAARKRSPWGRCRSRGSGSGCRG